MTLLRAWLALSLTCAFATTVAAGTINGTVRAAGTNAPLASKVVSAYDTTGTLRATATTDATGLYVLTVPAGSYRVLAFDPDGVYATAFDANAESFETSPLLTSGATDSVRRDFTLVVAGTVSGTVSGVGPLSEAVVEAYNLSGTRRAFTTTNAQGQFSMVLPPGDYKLVAYDSRGHYGLSFFRDVVAFADATPVTVRASQATAATFRLFAAGKLRGTVTDRANGLPLAGMDVYVYTPAGSPVRSTKTGADGSFTFTLPPGTYRLAAADPGRVFATGFAGDTTAFETSALVIVPTGGETVAQVALKRGATLAGRVVNASGAGIAGATVAAYNPDGTLHAFTTTATDGAYELVVAAGDYKFVAFDPALTYATRFYGAARDFATTAALGLVPGQNLRGFDFSLPLGGRISGTVREGSTARAGITVVAYDQAGLLAGSTVTNAAGAYAMVLPPGEYRLVAFDSDLRYAPSYDGGANTYEETVPRSIAAGAAVTADLALRRGVTVTGSVVDTSGRGLNGVTIFALDAAGQRVAGATSVDGSFALAVPAGTYKFVAIDGARRYSVTYYEGATTLAEARSVVIPHSGGLHFVLEEAGRRRAVRH